MGAGKLSWCSPEREGAQLACGLESPTEQASSSCGRVFSFTWIHVEFPRSLSEALMDGVYLHSVSCTLGRARIWLGPAHQIDVAPGHPGLGWTAGVWEATPRAKWGGTGMGCSTLLSWFLPFDGQTFCVLIKFTGILIEKYIIDKIAIWKRCTWIKIYICHILDLGSQE